MKKAEVVVLVIDIVKQNIFSSEPVVMNEGTTPVGGFDCFDSLVSVCCSVELTQKLGIDKKIPAHGLFIDKNDEGTYDRLTISQIADNLVKLMDNK